MEESGSVRDEWRLSGRGVRWSKTSMPEVAVRELTLAQAISRSPAEEMRRDPTVCVMGEDVAEAGTAIQSPCPAW